MGLEHRLGLGSLAPPSSLFLRERGFQLQAGSSGPTASSQPPSHSGASPPCTSSKGGVCVASARLSELGLLRQKPMGQGPKQQTPMSQSRRLGLRRGHQCRRGLGEGPLCLPLLTAPSQGEGRALISSCSYQGADPGVGTHLMAS